MRLLLLMLPWFAAGCVGVADMSASQIRATNGVVMCSQVTSIYGKGSAITVNADDVRKGSTSKGKILIVCGDATMTIDYDVGVGSETEAKSLVNLLNILIETEKPK